MKKSETKIRELAQLLNMQDVEPAVFIQFVKDVIDSMPNPWQDALRRFYLEGGMQRIDENTGRPLREDTKYHVMNEHGRRAFVTIVRFMKKNPEYWKQNIQN